MAADMNRTRQFTGRRPGQNDARPAGPTGTISQSAAHQDGLDNAQFEKKAAELSKPTTVRPMLITDAEVEQIRIGYSTGSGRLDVLTKVTNARDTLWQEMNNEAPFDRLSDGDRAKAETFFKANGKRLLGETRQAPPNPIRRDPPPAEDTSAPAPAAAPDPAAGGSAKPAAEIPGAQRGLATMPPPASLKIEFLSEQGYRCELTLHASSATLVLEQGGGALTKLAQAKARPLPPPGPAVVVQQTAPPAAGAARAESNGEPPRCKYHGPMKESKKPGTWFCPKKLADGSYCDQKVET